MKKIILFCILFIMLFSVGCTKNEKEDSGEKTKPSKKSEQISNVKEDTIEQLEKDISDGKAYIYNYPNVLNVKYFSGRNFSDEVAWVSFVVKDEESNMKLRYYCIDKKGKILFELTSGEPTSNFYNGKATLDNNTVIDKTGKIISSASDGLYDEIISNTIGDGVFVKKEIDTFDEKAIKIGLLDVKNNEWMISLTEDITSIDSNDINDEKIESNLRLLRGKNLQDKWYDCDTDTIIDGKEGYDILEKESTQSINKDDLKGAENYSDIEFSNIENGYCFVLFKGFKDQSDWYTVMNSEKEYMFEPRKADLGSIPNISCGVFFIQVYDEEKDDYDVECMDINGNVLIRNLPDKVQESEFKDDILYIEEYQNEEDDTKYYPACYVDKHGKRLWDWKVSEE